MLEVVGHPLMYFLAALPLHAGGFYVPAIEAAMTKTRELVLRLSGPALERDADVTNLLLHTVHSR